MRRFFSSVTIIAVFLSLLHACCACAEEFPPSPETPAPARIHAEPEPTAEPAVILNRTQTPDPLEGFHFKLDAKMLHVWFPNIANCDEAVIMYDDETWLIDCASEKMASRGVDMMRRLGISKIEKLFVSHPHYDHMEGLRITNESIPVDELLCGANFPPDTNETMINALTYAEESAIPFRSFEDGEVFTMGDGSVTLTSYYNDYTPELLNTNERGIVNHQNDCSAVSILAYGDRRILFMADMERNYGQSLFYPRIAAGLDLHADIIKYPHHGNNGMLSEFYDAVGPALAVITNSRGVQKPGIDFLLSKRAGIFYTNYPERYVHLYTDGHTWVIEYVPISLFPPLQ